MANDHIHTVGDGRGFREVFCDGRKLEACTFADTAEGYAICYRVPREIDHVNECLVTERVEGKITIEYIDEAAE